jgi:DNA invertase Pin-like site-specific DNA recombinase
LARIGALFANVHSFLAHHDQMEWRTNSMAGQGRTMREEELHKVIHLLAATEMSIAEIAERMSCSKSTVTTINRKSGVREYNGLRTRWLNMEREENPAKVHGQNET